jgi:hypothetical protein
VTETGEAAVLTAAAIHARRHPWAIVGLWGWQTLVALGASWPAAALVRATYGVDPRSDAPLWEAGAHPLVDFVWHNAHGLSAVTAAGEFTVAIGVVAGLFPTAAAMFAMAHTRSDRRPAGLMISLAGALEAMPSLLFLFAVAGIAQASAVGLGFAAGWAVEAWTHGGLGEAYAERIGLAVGFMFVLAASGLLVIHDLARAAVMRSQANGPRAFVLGARLFARSPVLLWWSWAWRFLAALAPVLAASAVATRVGGRGGGALVALAFLHQAVVLARVALRASWLARALRSMDPMTRGP